MATFSKINLSPGGTEGDGNPIAIAATSSTGTNIHDTGASASVKDEVWLWMTNIDTASIVVTLHFGYLTSGAVADVEKVFMTIPPKSGTVLVIPGQPLRGNGSVGRRIAAIAGTTNKINVMGFVNRITE